MRLAFFLAGAGLLASGAWALSPMHSYQDLVAGEGSPGFRDGPFYSALFRTPQGLAINPEGTRLYVADRENHCIRVVDLEHANSVSILAGTTQKGYADGPFPSASFNNPAGLIFLSGQRLVVNDLGNSRLRLIDLKTKTVSTLAGDGQMAASDGKGAQAQTGLVWGMAYLPSREELYFSQPQFGVLKKLDLKTGQVTTVMSGKPEISHPAALCADKEKIYAADLEQEGVYEGAPPGPGEATWSWKEVAKGHEVQSLAWSGKDLYALQKKDAPLARLLPDYQPVSFITLWGETAPHPIVECFLSDLLGPYTMDLVADPLSERKFYLSHPVLNIVTSLDLGRRDLKPIEALGPDSATDFQYPYSKPPGTYRILLIGDSHTFYTATDDATKNWGLGSLGWQTVMSKRLEATLNTLAALDDVPTRFDVMDYGEVQSEPVNLWPYYKVPRLVEKLDVDLVLYMLSPDFNFEAFYQRPYNDQGVPAAGNDPEYLLKPYQERIPKGLPQDIFDLCAAKKKLTILSPSQFHFAPLDELVEDPQIRSAVARLYARPMRLLKEKLASMKTRQGNPVRVEMVFLPYARFGGVEKTGADIQAPFWTQVLEETQAPSLDLSSVLTALRVSFYPFSEIGDNDHFTPDGHLLMGFLLAHELVHQKVVPFVSSPK